MLKRFVKNTFAFLVVFLVVFSISEKGQAATLSDIPSTAAKEINYLLEKESSLATKMGLLNLLEM